MNVIIVHGCPSDAEKEMDPKRRTYDKHWMPWLKRELEKIKIKVYTPLMPRPWNRDYAAWKEEFEKLNVGEETILIGHSCGAAFLVRWLGDTKKRVKRLILVAPWKIANRGDKIEFYDFKIDGTIRLRVKEITIFTSDDEEPDGKESVKIFHDVLGGKIIELKSRGHYTLKDMGTEEFPELLKEILK